MALEGFADVRFIVLIHGMDKNWKTDFVTVFPTKHFIQIVIEHHVLAGFIMHGVNGINYYGILFVINLNINVFPQVLVLVVVVFELDMQHVKMMMAVL